MTPEQAAQACIAWMERTHNIWPSADEAEMAREFTEIISQVPHPSPAALPPGAIAGYTDGSHIELGSWAGGAHPDGEWSHLELIFFEGNGTETHRDYDACDLRFSQKRATKRETFDVNLQSNLTSEKPEAVEEFRDLIVGPVFPQEIVEPQPKPWWKRWLEWIANA